MDHWQRIEAAMAGTATDRMPVALWRHFPVDDQDPGKLAAHTLAYQHAWDFDLVKFMPSGTYCIEDWGATTAYSDRVGAAIALRRLRQRGNLRHLSAVTSIRRCAATARQDQSTFAPEALTIGPQRFSSSWIIDAICSGLPPTIS